MSSIQSTNKVISVLKKLSNSELQISLAEYGTVVSVNAFTRGIIERRILAEVSKYTDEEVDKFIKDYFC